MVLAFYEDLRHVWSVCLEDWKYPIGSAKETEKDVYKNSWRDKLDLKIYLSQMIRRKHVFGRLNDMFVIPKSSEGKIKSDIREVYEGLMEKMNKQGSVSLKDVEDAVKYKGKIIKVAGTCI